MKLARFWKKFIIILALLIALILWALVTNGTFQRDARKPNIVPPASLQHSRMPPPVSSPRQAETASTIGNTIATETLDEEKERYFAEKNLNWKLLQQGITKPEFFFWVDRLSSKDEAKAMEAFGSFSEVCKLPRSVFSEKWPQDLREIGAFFSQNHRMASRDFYSMEGVPQIAKICDAVIPRLVDEELRESALKILNRATMDVYAAKDAAWWLSGFQNSKFAGFLQGLPREQWIHRPE